MSSVAVIPVRGRMQLIPYTIKQALKVVDRVICVTSRPEERKYCTGAETADLKNSPLGKVWNLGFELARAYDPDYILFIGSSDWVSENWMDVMTKYDAEIVGVKGFHLLHLDYKILITDKEELRKKKAHSGVYSVPVEFLGMETGYWSGYTNFRKGEPIGIGRVLNRDFLKRIGYKPFDDYAQRGMDFNMINLSKDYKVVDEDIQCLSVSTNLWDNLHDFIGDKINPGFLIEWFPMARELTEWTKANLTNYELRNGM